MYVPYQGLKAIQDERVNRSLRKAELRRLINESRQEPSRTQRRYRALYDRLYSALNGTFTELRASDRKR